MTPRLDSAARRRAEKIGRRSEWLASLWLRLKGFSILATRAKTPGGEIDIVAQRGKLIAFVEVKARADADAAIVAVTAKSKRRICTAAKMFLARHRGLADCDIRYDIIAVAGWRIRHIANAWRDGS